MTGVQTCALPISRGEVFVTSVDYASTRQITRTAAAERDLCFAPDSRTLAYASERDGRWNIYTASIARDEEPNFPNATLVDEKPLFDDARHERFLPRYSPDGKELAFIEDRCRLMVKNLSTGKVRQITDGSHHYSTTGMIDYSWSPDGKWFALTHTANRHEPYTDIGLVSAAGGDRIVDLTGSGYTDRAPRWVLGGEAILFLSERYGMRNHASWGSLDDVMIVFLNQEAYDRFRLTKEQYELDKEAEKKTEKKEGDAKKPERPAAGPTAVELRGIEERTVRLTPSSAHIADATVDKKGEKLYYLAAFGGAPDLWELDLRDRGHKMLQKVGGSGSLEWDAKHDDLFILGRGRMSKLKSGKLTPITLRAEMKIDPAAEREYMFHRVYREEKRRFYDERKIGRASGRDRV